MTGPVPLGSAAMRHRHDCATPVQQGCEVAVTVTSDTGGSFRVESPGAPGWRAYARNPVELARAVEAGMTEHRIASYAQDRGQPYDLTLHDQAAHDAATHHSGVRSLPVDADRRAAMIAQMPVGLPDAGHPTFLPRAGSSRPQTSTGQPVYDAGTYSPLAWRERQDGTWISPGGRQYGADTLAVRQVIAKRQAMGVGTDPGLPADLTARRDAVRAAVDPALAASMSAHPAGKGRHLRSAG